MIAEEKILIEHAARMFDLWLEFLEGEMKLAQTEESKASYAKVRDNVATTRAEIRRVFGV